jgi:uncharacterized protein
MNKNLKVSKQVSVTAVGRDAVIDACNQYTRKLPIRGSVYSSDIATQRLWENCQYPTHLSFRHYYDMYARNNVAARVIETFPNYTWNVLPHVFDSGKTSSRFSKQAKALLTAQYKIKDDLRLSLISAFKHLDILGGIGGEALLVFGFDDGGKLDQPVNTERTNRLVYLKILHNGQFDIDAVEEDDSKPTYGDTKMYVTKDFHSENEINFVNPIAPGKKIHYTRCFHFKESMGMAFGTSRIQKCYNQLLDIVKVSGASAEVYWLGAFSGLSIETHPDAVLSEEAKIAMKKGVEKYFSGLARALMFEGAKAKLLYPAIVSPEAHFDLQISMISIASEIPRRFLTGAEAAKLASQQDSINWMDRVSNRRNQFVTPNVIAPVIERCIHANVLPRPRGDNFEVYWPRTQSLPLNERADASEKTTTAIEKYFVSNMYKAMDFVAYLTGVCGFGEDEATMLAENTDLSKYVAPVKSSEDWPAKETTKKKEASE